MSTLAELSDDPQGDFRIEIHVMQGDNLKGIGSITIQNGKARLSYEEY